MTDEVKAMVARLKVIASVRKVTNSLGLHELNTAPTIVDALLQDYDITPKDRS